MTDQVSNVMVGDRFQAVLLTFLAAVGVLLAGGGLYSVVAYSVSQRRGELGLRLALGARPRDLLVLVLRQGGMLIAAGLLIGLVAARATSAAMGSLLYGVQPGDPATFASVGGVLAMIGLAACYVPARRAAGVDPAMTLRGE